MKKKRKEKKGKRNSVQELLGIRHFTNYGLMTEHGELVFFRVAPTNISVLSTVNIQQKITGLTNLLKIEPDMGIVCTDSCECFDSNLTFIHIRTCHISVYYAMNLRPAYCRMLISLFSSSSSINMPTSVSVHGWFGLYVTDTSSSLLCV